MSEHRLSFLSLLSWVSPSFPTGGYAYSHGIEWAVESGKVSSKETLCQWVSALLEYGSLGNDLLFLKAAWESAGNIELLHSVAEHACATASSKERYEEAIWQGRAFLRAASIWQEECMEIFDESPCPLPVAQGFVFACGGVTRSQALLAGGYSAVSTLVSATVRLVPLGQTDGLKALRYLEPLLIQNVQRIESLSLDEVGGACFYSDMSAMKHETQRTRLFRT